ncbi:Predicted nucleic acid-binding protein, contains PIN domain [Desulfofundulus thermosubterraneus DSM 16057]|uniref:Predicted nucleic acid-binding protein, contains PIN domain n=1 Tax=Desulfofundulus thermosubterraneus DSM 16057 TaxID=1121432 RepID=A0A1M6ICF0_9FIRM|nr:Predicted nucleic acid-binding protein, contains PIN domain [Desulfofundulus thermosubterraneus DSM 16057]
MKSFVKSKEIAIPIVVDTNVLVPSLYMATPLLRFVLSGNLILIWNDFIRSEACEIINRLAHRYFEKAGVSASEVNYLLDLVLHKESKVPEMPGDWPPHSPDRDDDPFLWAAIAGKAEYIISSDIRHMLKLKNIYGIPIGRPKDFFDWVKIAHPMS